MQDTSESMRTTMVQQRKNYLHVAKQDTELSTQKNASPPLAKRKRKREKEEKHTPGQNVDVAAYCLECDVKALDTEKSDEQLVTHVEKTVMTGKNLNA